MVGYDIVWGCFFIEIAWIAFIFVFRPYKNISEYVLSAGNCLVTTISNIALLVATYKNIENFNFALSVSLVIITCLSAIASMFIFLIFDFKTYDYDDEESEFSYKSTLYLSYFSKLIAPIVWLFYAINIPLINGNVKLPSE